MRGILRDDTHLAGLFVVLQWARREHLLELLLDFGLVKELATASKDFVVVPHQSGHFDVAKAFYSEAVTAQPGNATPDDIQSWLWNETVLGKILLTLYRQFQDGQHTGLAALADFALVPRVILKANNQERPSKPLWHTPQQ